MMRRFAQYILLTVAFAGACAAQYSAATGWCEQGAGTININGNSNNPPAKFQKSYPACTLTVYLPGTTTKAPIFSNTTGTALSNPFTSSTTAQWLFYAAGGDYDVQVSGVGVSSPFTVRSVHVASNGSVIDVTDAPYFAKCNGTTDDSAAIRAAVTAAGNFAAITNSASKVVFPPGTCLVSLLIWPSSVWLAGSATGATTLKAPAGVNADVIQGANFLTLTNTPAQIPETRGANFTRITDMTIDGNKANNSTGYCIRIWGHSMYWDNVTAQNCATGGIWTEYSDGSGYSFFPSNPKLGDPASYFKNIKGFTNGNSGDWTYYGPNDGNIDGLICSGTTGNCLTTDTKIVDTVIYHVGTLDKFTDANAYGNTGTCFYFGPGATVLAADSIVAGACTNGLFMDATDGSSKMTNMTIAGNPGYGVTLQGGHNSFSGEISRNGTGFIIQNLVDAFVDIHGDGNTVTAINDVSESGGNFIRFGFNVPMGADLVTFTTGLGHWHASTTIEPYAYNTVNCNGPDLPCSRQIPGLLDTTTTPGQAFVVAQNPTTPTDYVRIYHTGSGGNGGIDALGTGNLVLNASAPTKPVVIGSILQLSTYTVSSGSGFPALPTCNSTSRGETALASDLTTPTYGAAAVGGGAVLGLVTCNGANWVTP